VHEMILQAAALEITVILHLPVLPPMTHPTTDSFGNHVRSMIAVSPVISSDSPINRPQCSHVAASAYHAPQALFLSLVTIYR
jgi:hypothetical protein